MISTSKPSVGDRLLGGPRAHDRAEPPVTHAADQDDEVACFAHASHRAGRSWRRWRASALSISSGSSRAATATHRSPSSTRSPTRCEGGGALPGGDYPPPGTCRSSAASPYGPAGTSHLRGSPSRDVI